MTFLYKVDFFHLLNSPGESVISTKILTLKITNFPLNCTVDSPFFLKINTQMSSIENMKLAQFQHLSLIKIIIMIKSPLLKTAEAASPTKKRFQEFFAIGIGSTSGLRKNLVSHQ